MSIESIKKASNMPRLLKAFDQIVAASQQASAVKPAKFGVEKQHRVSIERTRKEANAKALDVLKKYEQEGPDSITNEDRQTLAQYTGLGGIGGSVHEYYTPDHVANGAWDALKSMGFENGNVLEPSAGAGVFHHTKPESVLMTATEISEESAQINQILHPEDKVLNTNFEKLAADVEDGHYDAVIGNVPFSDNRGGYGGDDPEYKDIPTPELYFFLRSLDKVKHGGLVALVAPVRIVDRKDFAKYRRMMSLKGEFMGAHRLPSGTFANNGTDVPTDLVIFRKHSEEAAEKIADMKAADLKSANVLWDTFISGKWFEKDGKRFVMGESSRSDYQNRLQVKADSSLTSKAITEKLAHRFESRIDWTLLNAAEPFVGNYAEGDQRKINGRWHIMKDGDWELVSFASGGGEIDSDKYGAETENALAEIISTPNGGLEVTREQAANTKEDFSHLITAGVSDALTLSASVDDKYADLVYRGTQIGQKIQDLGYLSEVGSDNPELRAEIKGLITDMVERYGPLKSYSKLTALSGKGSSALNQFLTSMVDDATFTDLIEGKQKRNDIQAWNNTDPVQVVTFLYTQRDLHPVDLDAFNETYKGAGGTLTLTDLSAYEGIAITADGLLEPMDRYCSGNIKGKIQNMLVAMGEESNSAIRNRYQYQYERLKGKRKTVPIDNITVGMRAKWVDRKYVLEFLHENGYDRFEYGTTREDEDGSLFIDTDTSNTKGMFSGYQFSATGKKLTNKSDESFERQLENYLSFRHVLGDTANHNRRIKQLEADFEVWIRQHDDIDQITELYNDTFNSYVDFEHSQAPLALSGVAEAVKHYGYQNSAIRRLSEDGRGILAFGTGLGKTFTALGAAAYDLQMGRSRRICVVVPKSVIENWYHESKQFFGKYHGKRVFVVPVEAVLDDDGDVVKEPWLDTNGNQRVNEHTGEKEYRDKIAGGNSTSITKRMNMIPQSSYEVVIMTKEQFKSIPMRPTNKEAYVDEMVSKKLMTAPVAMKTLSGDSKMGMNGAKSYTEAKKTDKFKDRYSEETDKKQSYPFFEDMGFDRVIVDEGHNYRNSYAAGSESSKLAYLPTAGAAAQSTDMALKTAYVKKKNDGRGVMLLTATPTVNSPTDIFNMLSLCMTPEEWLQFGIADVDDFVRVFGETDSVNVQMLSGKIAEKQALVGFKNLDGLRGLFNSLVNMKKPKDVAQNVKLPDLEEKEISVELSEQQQEIYEELRTLADSEEREKLDEEDRVPIFSIIRDMDRVATDIDLYNHTMTFHFPVSEQSQVEALVAALPKSKKLKVKDDDKEDEGSAGDAETITVEPNAEIQVDGKTLVLVVDENFEDEVIKGLKKAKIDESKVSHPLPPKYARMLENIKEHIAAGGKQLIFTEEKSQHNKLKRLIAFHTDLEPNLIGVINADTTTGKKGSESLDDISEAYNTGKYKIVIANKKAEVGVNLHHGTTAMHHLTLPWTPASIDQRNGRGRRVGAKQSKVEAYYYLGNGSFDAFRLQSLKRKAGWMHELFTGEGATMKNADANDEAEMQLLLAKDPEDLKRRMEEARRQQEAQQKAQIAQRAGIDLHNYIKAQHTLTLANEDDGQAHIARLTREIAELTKTAEEAEEAASRARPSYGYGSGSGDKEVAAQRAKKELKQTKAELKRLKTAYRNKEKAQRTTKQLRSKLDADIKNGTLTVDESILDTAHKAIMDKSGNVVRVGDMYQFTHNEMKSKNKIDYQQGVICTVISVDADAKEITARSEFQKGGSDYSKFGAQKEFTVSMVSLPLGWKKTSYSLSDIEIMSLLKEQVNWEKFDSFSSVLTKEVFTEFAQKGHVKYGYDYHYYRKASGELTAHLAFKMPDMAEMKPLYPDASDKGFREELAKYVLDQQKEKGRFPLESNRGFLRIMFGEDYESAIAGYGEVVSQADVTKAMERHLESWLKLDSTLTEVRNVVGDPAEEITPKPYMAVRVATKWMAEFKESTLLSDIKGDNLSEIDQWISERGQALKDEYAAMAEAAVQAEQRRRQAEAEAAQREKERLEALEAAAKADKIAQLEAEPAEVRNERIEWLTQHAKGFESDIDFSRSVRLEAPSGLPYFDDEGDSDLLKIETDLRLFFEAYPERDINRDRLRSMLNAFWAIAKGLSVGDTSTEHEGTYGTITIKKNSTPLLGLKKGKWNKRDYDQFEAYGIHDSDGRGGKLMRVKDDIKAATDARFKNDVSSEFPGAWWFIPVSSDMKRIKSILGVDDES